MSEIECLKKCDDPRHCNQHGHCFRIGPGETVAQVRSDSEALKMGDQPHGWIWLDDDGWEHSLKEQHPQLRGEAEYGTNFRPATEAEAQSDQFFRAPEIHYSFRLVS